MKELINREETIDAVNKHFDRLEKIIREHCILSDAVLVISKCGETKNALKQDLRQVETRAVLEDLPKAEDKMKYCMGCKKYIPRSVRGVSDITCVNYEFCKYHSERLFERPAAGSGQSRSGKSG